MSSTEVTHDHHWPLNPVEVTELDHMGVTFEGDSVRISRRDWMTDRQWHTVKTQMQKWWDDEMESIAARKAEVER